MNMIRLKLMVQKSKVTTRRKRDDKRAGSGVPNIINVWADEGWEEPMLEERFDPDRTVLGTVAFFQKSGDKK